MNISEPELRTTQKERQLIEMPRKSRFEHGIHKMRYPFIHPCPLYLLVQPFKLFYQITEKQVRIGFVCANARYGPPVRTPWRITVENLSTRISWQVSSG